MRGRKPKPAELKRREGNLGRRPIEDNEPEFEFGPGDAPEHLDAIAKAEWLRVASLLTAARVITEADRAILAVYCAAWSRWVRSEAILVEKGEILTSEDGGQYQNPHLSVARRASETLIRTGASLGLDPSTRPRIAVPVRQAPKVATRPKTRIDSLGPPRLGVVPKPEGDSDA